MFILVLAIQAKKKRYKAQKARMKPDDSKTKAKRYGDLHNSEKEPFCFQDFMDFLCFLSHLVGVYLVSMTRITKWTKTRTKKSKRIQEIILKVNKFVFSGMQERCLEFIHLDRDLS